MTASLIVAAAMIAPWLTVLPLHGPAAVITHALSLLAAYHGAGLVVARLTRQPAASPWLVVHWGIAALIGLSGIAIAVGAGTLGVHAALVFGFAAVHTGALGARFTRYADRIDDGLAGARRWLVPVALLAGLGAITVLGAAGDSLARPFDDEGDLAGQLARVLQTGTLADPIGYPRGAQLGAQVALAAIASGAGDGAARLVEPLALVLALGLAISQIRARDPSAALWAALLITAASALALAPTDPLPCWTAAGLSTTLYVMLGETEPPPALPLALAAGALIALRYELAPVAAIALIAAWWRRPFDHHRTAVLIGGAFAVGFPFLVTRMLAWRSVPAAAHAALTPREGALLGRAALAAVIAVPAACLLRAALPDSRALRAAATASASALGAIVAHLTGGGLYSLRLLWPIAIGFAIILAIELARSRALGAAALISSLVLCLFIYDGREAPGRLRWSRRLATAATDLGYVQHPPPEAAAPYADLLAGIPADATIAAWVAAPEQLDYAHHRIFDLRTPAAARLRRYRWEPHASPIESLVTTIPASYLLLEGDDSRIERGQTDMFYRVLCQTDQPMCADDLEAIALHHPVIARRDNVALVDLRR